MTAPAERTRSMREYAEVFGDPDAETSARMEQRLEAMIAAEEAGGGKPRRWLPWIAVIALVATAGVMAGVFLGRGSGDTAVTCGERPQRLRVSAGSIVLQPGAEMRVLHDDGRTVVELRAGTVDIEASAGSAGIQVLNGAYSVEATDARLVVEHAAGLPVVTVSTGEAIVRGPDLPDRGIVVVPVLPPADVDAH